MLNKEELDRFSLQEAMSRFAWQQMAPRYDRLLEKVAGRATGAARG
jgi:hypothetical protein